MTKKAKKFNRRGKLQRVEDIDDPEAYEKRELVKILMYKCSKTQEEVLEEYNNFYKQHSDGLVTKEEYINSTENCLEAEALFRVFDEDNSGTLSFYEYMQAANLKKMKKPEEKLRWIFTAFDADGGGTIDVEEIREIVVWLFRLAGIDEDEDLLASCLMDIRDTIDEDRDGDISMEEFVKNAMNSKFVASLVKTKERRKH
eukprot:GFUD01089418.1.p1 GENE.GFUD01089418.1~~GFUD01089418.1.p1  ORF type:complete len:200 (-),score=72.88 GFUD01089418.1:90-689(-)